MKFLRGCCRKCGIEIKIDLEGTTPEEARVLLGKRETFECPGHHVELSGPLNYWEIDWDTVHEDDTRQPTEEAWLAEKRERYEHVVKTSELNFVVDKVLGFSMGLCVVMRNGEEEYADFANSPSGERYYFIGPKAVSSIA